MLEVRAPVFFWWLVGKVVGSVCSVPGHNAQFGYKGVSEKDAFILAQADERSRRFWETYHR